MRTSTFIFTIIFFSLFNSLNGQKLSNEYKYNQYFLIDDLSKAYKLNAYTLNTKELYGIDKTIQVYNFILGKGMIVLASVLPYLYGEDNWVKVDLEKIKDRMITDEYKTYKFFNNMDNPDNNISKSLDYAIVKKVGSDYFVPRACLIEIFSIRSYPKPFVLGNGILNISAPNYSIKEIHESYRKEFPDTTFPLDFRHGNYVPYDSKLSTIYKSKDLKIKDEKAYQFWTFEGWVTDDYYNIRRGIDRIVYMPEKGIVGGSYDFYFWYHLGLSGKIPVERFWDNIINEKVMLAEELK